MSVSLDLAGAEGWLCDELLSLLDSRGSEQRSPIYVTGYVDDDDLPILYSGASVFLYPSLWMRDSACLCWRR